MNKSATYYIEGILQKDRVVLSQTITLLESTLKEDIVVAETVIDFCLKQDRKSKVIGITGIPGVGKSTFINALGKTLLEQQQSIAVLTVDPSSFKNKGSILADKTRMLDLVNDEQVYIRSSASYNFLGGLRNSTFETILLCDVFGFDYILVESVGVGQSEIDIQNLVDMVLMITVCNTGDELQGIKRGIMEIVDAVIINKIDISNELQIKTTTNQLKQALHLLQPKYDFWTVSVLQADALSNKNIDLIVDTIDLFFSQLMKHTILMDKRNQQKKLLLEDKFKQKLLELFFSNPKYQLIIDELKNQNIDLYKMNQIISALQIDIKT